MSYVAEMNRTKRRRAAIFVTLVLGILAATLVGSTSAGAVDWWGPNNLSYSQAMVNPNGGRFEVQPGDPNHNTASLTEGLPGDGRWHQAALILKGWYSAGLGYYWFYVRCDTPWQHDAQTIIGRGSFIPDYQRPYVGIFYQPDGNLVMYKYAKDAAGNRTDSWVIGALYTQLDNGVTHFDGYGTFSRGSYISQSYC